MESRLFQGDEVPRLFCDDVFGWRSTSRSHTSYTPVTAELVVVEGQVRWMRESRVHDTATVCCCSSKDDKLFSLTAPASKNEAPAQARALAGKDSAA
jgi:hypothetical protein